MSHLRNRLAEVLPQPAAGRLAATADGFQLQRLFGERTPSVADLHRALSADC